MHRLSFRIEIDAPQSLVYTTMLEDATYREWTAEFSPGSYFQGDWTEGSRIRFVGPGENGEGGIVSRVRTNRPYEYIELEHLGIVGDGKEDTTSETAREWAGAHESYTFNGAGDRTELLIEVDTTEEYAEAFGEMWPRALARLKTIAEKAERR